MKLLLENYENELSQLAKEALEIKVLIAFLTKGGLSWLPDELPEVTEFIVGIDLRITTNEAIQTLIEKQASVFIFEEKGKLFHPKVLYFKTKRGEFLVIGSNNLTGAGIGSNHEVSVRVDNSNAEEQIQLFEDFNAHFEKLKKHECCKIPNDKFLKEYAAVPIKKYLEQNFPTDQSHFTEKALPVTFRSESTNICGVRDFIHVLVNDFPRLDRKKSGKVIGNPLKELNDKQFDPCFKEFISSASNGRMTGNSSLNHGGVWFRIPNIIAVNESREPWDHVHDRGRLIMQIHFLNKFQQVILSIVLQYALEGPKGEGTMLESAEARYQRLLAYLKERDHRGKRDLPKFYHWKMQGAHLFSKPILSFEYEVASLPSDDALKEDARYLAELIDGALTENL